MFSVTKRVLWLQQLIFSRSAWFKGFDNTFCTMINIKKNIYLHLGRSL